LFLYVNLWTSRMPNALAVSNKDRLNCNLHFADNLNQAPIGEPAYDKLYRVRPLLTSLLEQFKQSQLMKIFVWMNQLTHLKKNTPWNSTIPRSLNAGDIKVFVLADSCGMVYNFEVYTGCISPCKGQPDIGTSGNIVLTLSSIIPDNTSHKLYFDN